MSDSTLAKSFEPQNIESQWGPEWEKRGYAAPAFTPGAKNFSIQLPPPNVTGTLHMGHAFNQTIMDGLTAITACSAKTRCGCRARTTRASPRRSSSNVSSMRKASSRHDLGREAFLERVWAWKQNPARPSRSQVRRLGASIDWSREYFTMDDEMSAAVRDVFVRLYERGPDLSRQAAGELGSRCSAPPSPTSKSSARKKTATSGTSAIRSPTARAI